LQFFDNILGQICNIIKFTWIKSQVDIIIRINLKFTLYRVNNEVQMLQTQRLFYIKK